MRLATYNVEWFNGLFNDEDQVVADGGRSARYGVTRAQQAQAIAQVLRALDADGLMIVEAPDHSHRRNAVVAMERFARFAGLRANTALIGFANDTQQEIVFLYDPLILSARHAPVQGTEQVPAFNQSFRIDLDIDAEADTVVFSKPPFEVDVQVGGRRLHLIGAHLKSKAPHGARTRDAVMRQSIANRRKQLAQAIWLRRRVEQDLAAGASLIVMGDLNDGPGLDEYEDLFGRSSVEIILGDDPALFDPHAAQALQRRLGAAPTTARFFLKQEKRYLQALLDYIMVSPDLMAQSPEWRIWHPFDDPQCWQDLPLREALLTASDHFPVTLDLKF